MCLRVKPATTGIIFSERLVVITSSKTDYRRKEKKQIGSTKPEISLFFKST